jgi:hypothetical protein
VALGARKPSPSIRKARPALIHSMRLDGPNGPATKQICWLHLDGETTSFEKSRCNCGKAKYAHFNKIENLKIDLATWQNKLIFLMILHK